MFYKGGIFYLIVRYIMTLPLFILDNKNVECYID
jgi:membrane-anchored glycerophosphoryl diester phosphodiesterase (GDPDase)